MDKQGWAENIADEARASISDFCINECKAYCCRKGFLIIKLMRLTRFAREGSKSFCRGNRSRSLRTAPTRLTLTLMKKAAPARRKTSASSMQASLGQRPAVTSPSTFGMIRYSSRQGALRSSRINFSPTRRRFLRLAIASLPQAHGLMSA